MNEQKRQVQGEAPAKFVRPAGRRVVVPFAIGILALFSSFAAAQPTPAELDQSIASGVKFLLDRQQPDGGWHDENLDETAVGRTALVCMALLNSGESHQSPAMRKAIEFLKKNQPDYTYSIGLRAAYFSLLPESLRKTQLEGDTRWLLQAANRRGNPAGLFTYRQRDGRGGDYSNTQYGLLGVWYAAASGHEIPVAFWRNSEKAWRDGQNDDGGWGYRQEDTQSYASMTAAGIASMYVTYDYLHAQQERDLTKRVVAQDALKKGVDWLAEHFNVDQNAGRDFALDPNRPLRRRRAINFGMSGTYIYYMLFGFERVGEATGLTLFGANKWFDDGADYILKTQREDGGWDGAGEMWRDCNSAYALLFLSRGRAPVALQKLDFGGRWNNRSRDAAQLARWLSRQTERHMNWQIVNLSSTAAELRESPILYLASDRALELPPEARTKLKQYIEQGGILLCANEGNGKAFARSVEALGADLFPKYAFRDLPPDHLIFTANFPTKESAPLVRSLSNGVRELIVLLPEGDLSWRWQSGAGTNIAAKAPQFGLIGNLHLYVTDRANPKFKGDDAWVDADPRVETPRTVSIARLTHNGNADPEPAGFLRFANMLHNDGIDAQVQLIEPAALGNQALAHMTAAGAFTLTSGQSAKLKSFLDSGGLLLFDAAGGSSSAATSMRDLLQAMYPNAKLEPLPLEHPIYSGRFGGREIVNVTYRKYAVDKLPRTTLPRLRGFSVDGKLRAIISDEDINSGLVGHNIDGIIGYAPGSAVDLMRNIVLWRMAGK